MILCIGTTPAAQRVMTFSKLELDKVNRATQTLDGIAGKSINVAKVLGTLGATVVAVGFAGGQRGREMLKLLEARNIQTSFVEVASQTRQCTTVLDQSASTVTELVEESPPVGPEDYEELNAVINKLLPRCQTVVMSGSLTPGGPVDFYRRITTQANQLGVLPIIDAQGQSLLQALEGRPGLVKPNRQELAATVERSLTNESEVITAMREVQRRGAARVVVTAGKEASLALDVSSVWRITTPTISVVNPIGSGDAFTAGLAWQLTSNQPLGEACRWAAAAGAANALSFMPGDLDRRDIERLADEVQVHKL